MSSVTPIKHDVDTDEVDDVNAHVSRALAIADLLESAASRGAVPDLADGTVEWAANALAAELRAVMQVKTHG